MTLLGKLPVELGRRIVIVVPTSHTALNLSIRNVPNVKTLLAAYLNPEDIVSASKVIFLDGALQKAAEVFGKSKRDRTAGKSLPVVEEKKVDVKVPKAKKVSKKAPPKKAKKSSSPTA